VHGVALEARRSELVTIASSTSNWLPSRLEFIDALKTRRRRSCTVVIYGHRADRRSCRRQGLLQVVARPSR
jgi:hypothetical protein